MASKTPFLLAWILVAAAAAANAQGTEPDRNETRLPRVTISGRAPGALTEPAQVTEIDDAPLGKTPLSV